MSFPSQVSRVSLRDRVRSLVKCKELGVETLLLHIERNQLRWLYHLVRRALGCLSVEVVQACPTGRRTGADQGLTVKTRPPDWSGNTLGFPQKSEWKWLGRRHSRRLC